MIVVFGCQGVDMWCSTSFCMLFNRAVQFILINRNYAFCLPTVQNITTDVTQILCHFCVTSIKAMHMCYFPFIFIRFSGHLSYLCLYLFKSH